MVTEQGEGILEPQARSSATRHKTRGVDRKTRCYAEIYGKPAPAFQQPQRPLLGFICRNLQDKTRLNDDAMERDRPPDGSRSVSNNFTQRQRQDVRRIGNSPKLQKQVVVEILNPPDSDLNPPRLAHKALGKDPHTPVAGEFGAGACMHGTSQLSRRVDLQLHNFKIKHKTIFNAII